MHPYLNKNINVQMISFVIPLYMNNQKEIDGYNRNARADNPAIKDGQSTDRHATCSFAQRKGNVEPLCWELAARWFGGKEDGIKIKNNESNGEGKAVEKVKHQEKYERHIKWELAMEIELYFT